MHSFNKYSMAVGKMKCMDSSAWGHSACIWILGSSLSSWVILRQVNYLLLSLFIFKMGIMTISKLLEEVNQTMFNVFKVGNIVT